MRLSQKGQNLVDYALLIGLVGIVIVGMQVYIKRGMQGKIKDVSDLIFGSSAQSTGDPATRSSNYQMNSTMTSSEFDGGGRSLIGEEHATTQYNESSQK